jgi:hypothetical protein
MALSRAAQWARQGLTPLSSVLSRGYAAASDEKFAIEVRRARGPRAPCLLAAAASASIPAGGPLLLPGAALGASRGALRVAVSGAAAPAAARPGPA